MHNIYEGPLLKRLRLRLFGPTAKEQTENIREFSELRAAAAERQRIEDAEDQALLDQHFPRTQ